MKYLPVYVLSIALALFIFLFAAQQEETASAEAAKEQAATELLFSLIDMNQVERENASLKNQMAELESRQIAEVPAQFIVVSAPGKGLRPFGSKAELQEWLKENYIKDAPSDRCVDTALELCSLAWQGGYQMSTEVLGDGELEGHMICSTIIGSVIYFIEPGHTAIWVGGTKKG